MAVESVKALAAFHEYCSLGPDRTLQKLADQSGRSVSTLELWSSRFNWRERAKQYDIESFDAVVEKTAQAEAQIYEALITDLLESSKKIAQDMETEIGRLREASKLGGQAVATIWKTATELKLSLAKQLEERYNTAHQDQSLAAILRAATQEELEVIERVINRLEAQEEQ